MRVHENENDHTAEGYSERPDIYDKLEVIWRVLRGRAVLFNARVVVAGNGELFIGEKRVGDKVFFVHTEISLNHNYRSVEDCVVDGRLGLAFKKKYDEPVSGDGADGGDKGGDGPADGKDGLRGAGEGGGSTEGSGGKEAEDNQAAERRD